MFRSRLFKIALLLLLIIGCIWHFIIKDYNYRITFTISQPSGIVYSHLIKWNNGKLPNEEAVTTLKQKPFSEVEQNLTLGDSVLNINWILKKKNDSTTFVVAKVRDTQHSFKQNLQMLSGVFYKNLFMKQSISAVKNFSEILIQNKRNYKLSEVVPSKIPSKYCAFIKLKSTTENKAAVMVRNIPTIMYYIKDNDLSLDGDPFSEITEWNIENDSIQFNFCFPIKKRDSFPETQEVFFKETKERKALKTIFNGNYKISHMSWYQMMSFAESNNIDIERLPVEFYLNDPHEHGNDLEWVAEIYMPIKN